MFDYTAGEVDWFAGGLPREGKTAHVLRAGDVARQDVATCHLADRIGDVGKRGQQTYIVVNDQNIVLGRLRGEALKADPDTSVESVMEAGPGTIRPDEPLESISRRMQERNLRSVLVTYSNGRLLGLLEKRHAEEALNPVQGVVEGTPS
ncbi:MAG TPA: CBS domain-containing protein [Dehalococcoidia bacterium]|nr:CBS domain-containing protein [Dehalococcoidia bacterium]